MIGYELPTSVSVCGVEYAMRTDFRVILDVLDVMDDADLPHYAKMLIMGIIMFPGWKDMPNDHRNIALKKAVEFIDCGNRDDGKPHPKLVSWKQDAEIIVPAINSIAHTEIRALPYLHWWTFLGYFMEIRESIFASVIQIRQKKALRKKLEKWEDEFYRNNRKLIDICTVETDEEKAVRENMQNWLDA